MRTNRWTSALAVSLATCLAVSVCATVETPATAQPSAADTASEHFSRGVGFYKDGDFTAAMVEFKRAYEIDPNYPVLYNIGQTSRELRDYAAALTAFQKYLTEGAKASDQTHLNAHKDKVEGYVNELKPKIAIVTLSVNQAGAEISVDDVVVGNSPLDKSINVNAGRRKISVTKSGYVPIQKFIDVGGTDQKSVSLELVPLGGGGPDVPIKHGPDQGETKTSLSPYPFVALGITGVAGIATIALGVKAIGAHSDFDTALNTFPGNSSDIESKRSSAKTFALAADIMGGVTGAAAVVTIVLFATNAGGSTKPKAALNLQVGPGNVGLSGSF